MWARLYSNTDQLGELRVASNQDGRLEVFGVAPDNSIWHTWQIVPGGEWIGSWSKLYSNANRFCKLYVASNQDGRLEVFGVAPDNSIWHTWQIVPGGDWIGSWSKLYNNITSRFREVYTTSNKDGRLEVFSIAPNYTTWHTWQIEPGGDWNGGWNEVYSNTNLLRKLCVASNQDSRLEIFGIAPDNTIWHAWQVAVGQWSPTSSRVGRFDLQEVRLGMAGVHAAMLHTGQVLYFSYDPKRENTLERALWHLWDPAGDISPVRVHARNLFCAGHCFLADGRLLVSGGQSYNWFPMGGRGADHDVHTFNPKTNTWARHEDMPGARWYPTCVTLPNGNSLIAGGHAIRYRPFGAINDEYEIFQWQTDEKTHPHRFNPGHIDAYPFLCVLPDGTSTGTLFAFSRCEARLFSLENQTWTGAFPTASQHWRTYNRQGAFVLLPLLPSEPEQSRVMVFGGEGPGSKATNTAEIFEFNQSNPSASSWRSPVGGDMAFQRFMSDAVLLPDGTVLVVNGSAEGVADDSRQPVMAAELFDPRDESWHSLASLNRPRQYHSTALLLPDARVVISGHTEHWNPGHETEDVTLDVYSPPYLFDGPRPTIESAPLEMSYGVQYDITITGHVESVALIRAGSTTHTNNMDQRYVGLLLRHEGDRLVVTAPRNGTVAPPGYYMLFVVNHARVPSIAKWVHVDARKPGSLRPRRSVCCQHQLLLSGSYDKTIRLWDPVKGAELQTLKGHSGSVNTVVFSPDSRLLASGSYDCTVRLWHAATGALQETFSTEETVTELEFSQDLNGKQVLWLPLEARPSCSAIKSNTLALGHASGRVSFIGLRV